MSTPFGKADLATCESEQIHLPGSIQPHGYLIVVDPDTERVVQLSANCESILGLQPAEVIGAALDVVAGGSPDEEESLRRLLRQLADVQGEPDAVARGRVTLGGVTYVASAHETPAQGVVLELEPELPGRLDALAGISEILGHVSTATTLETLCAGVADRFRKVSGYDRVMVYRFDEDGHGEVFAESRRTDLESFLGTHYPATDIPQMARRLYVRNRVRVLCDVDYFEQAILTERSPIDGEPLDMSMCVLRSLSPIHLQYLRNMGVSATLVASLVVGGKLWGLLACHHYEPRRAPPHLRVLTELAAEVVAVRISALRTLSRVEAQLRVQRLESRLAEAVSKAGDWSSLLRRDPASLLDPVEASGASLISDGKVLTLGDGPSSRDVLRLTQRVAAETTEEASFSTSSLALDWPDLEGLLPEVAGILAVRLTKSDDDWLMWYRPEQVRTVTWGGDPREALLVSNDPKTLTPRRSFAAWHQSLVKTSRPWSDHDRAFAEMAGASIGDIVFQFRAVRRLIVQSQRRELDAKILHSFQPALLADQAGRIEVASETWLELFGETDLVGTPLERLGSRFAERERFLDFCSQLIDRCQDSATDLVLLTDSGDRIPLWIRGGVVLSGSQANVLGYVISFDDMSLRRAAETAQRRVQRVIDSGRSGITEAGIMSSVRRIDGLLDEAAAAAVRYTTLTQEGLQTDLLGAVESSIRRSRSLLDGLIRQTLESTD
jgi:chemotaxis family two-component system sensor kinase Cph1